MDEKMAKDLVVKAGKELVKSGLIARTWGNVSCRIDEKYFAITPSGRSYESLTPNEIVICRIEDLEYEGDIKPSSEKGVHSIVYKLYPEINFVIHTHQPKASAISTTNIGKLPSGSPICDYGLPGTKKLMNAVEKAMKESKAQSIMMSHHGVLCFGKDYEETFKIAKDLEIESYEFIKQTYLKISNDNIFLEKNLYKYYAPEKADSLIALYNSRRTKKGFIINIGGEREYAFQEEMPYEAQIHSEIYQKRSDINFISQNTGSGLVAISHKGHSLKPLLDDFAQIVGVSVKCAKLMKPDVIEKALKGRLGVLIPGAGALCLASSEYDLEAVEMVMEKNAFAQISQNLFGGGKAINKFECILMHFVYTKSYAKRAKS